MPRRACLKVIVCLFSVLPALGQQLLDSTQIPPNFKLDLETAARLRPELMAQSTLPGSHYAAGAQVFKQLLEQLPKTSSTKFAWQLRIVDDDQLDAYASPDGAIFVESGLAKLAGQSNGLWAAILSHEIAHVIRRDWARRYLYQKSLESSGNSEITLGDPGLPSTSWITTEKASENLGRFCRQMEIDADRESLMLMARAGFHPDFAPALHHILHAEGSGAKQASLNAMHPAWEERDRELMRTYMAARIEFEHRWPDWYASPGGNPPVVIFADAPKIKKASSSEWQIQVPMRCQNLAGTVEVVLRVGSADKDAISHRVTDRNKPGAELRQLTGCTSDPTVVTFNLANVLEHGKVDPAWTDVYVFDVVGDVLDHAEAPKLPH